MNRLPFELLNLIVYFIETEPSLPTRRSALASLSRTNRTFNDIATPKLYLHVVLTSENRVGQWGNVYASKLNPWNLKDATHELRHLVVPTSITFVPSIADEVSTFFANKNTLLTQQRPRVDPLLAVSTPLTSFFFRNLTSLVVSPNYNINPQFIASLLGPTEPLRSTLLHLDLRGDDLEAAICFLMESAIYNEYSLDEEEFDWVDYEVREEEKAAYLERRSLRTLRDEAEEEPDWLWENNSFEATEQRLISKAWIDFESFAQLHVGGPRLDDALDCGLHRTYAFEKLESCTFSITHDVQVKLALLTGSSFPSLSHLKLVGLLSTNEDDFPRYVKIWRVSVTERQGTILAPLDVGDLAEQGGFALELLEDLVPIPKTEAAVAPAVLNYPGPSLLSLDLSELRLVSSPY